MSDTPKNGGFLGGDETHEPSIYALNMATKAIQDDYPINVSHRALLIEKAVNVLTNSKSVRKQMAAGKLLLAADSWNLKNRSVAIKERGQEFQEQTQAIREAMMRPDIRRKLVEMAKVICAEDKPAEVPVIAGPAPSLNGKHA